MAERNDNVTGTNPAEQADDDMTTDRTVPNESPDGTRAPSTPTRRTVHDTDVTSLVFGLVFLGLVGVWALVTTDVVSWPDASRIFPILLVVAGLVGLVSSVRRRGRSNNGAG